MKQTIIFIILLFIYGCSKPKVFILEDKNHDKYFLIEKIESAYDKKQIKNSPLVAIDGIPFRYNKKLDTIPLPLKREDINRVTFLHENSTHLLYGENEVYGAIIITTNHK